jgi:hypothetical protein
LLFADLILASIVPRSETLPTKAKNVALCGQLKKDPQQDFAWPSDQHDSGIRLMKRIRN